MENKTRTAIGQGRLVHLRYKKFKFESSYANVGGFYSICFMGTYDPLLSSLRSNDTLLDGGANIGVFSVLASPLVRKVFAVEPHPYNFRLLCENLARNHSSNVVPIQAALSAHSGEALFQGEGEVGYLSNRGQRVRTMTIDQVGGREITCMKLDIEGAEVLSLMGMKTLSAVRAIAFELDQDHLDLVNSEYPAASRDVGERTYAGLVRYLEEAGFRTGDYTGSGINILRKVVNPGLIYDEMQTGLFGFRALLRLYTQTGKNLLSPRTLSNPRLNMIYCIRSD
jgi:FkbM family methyltransferase